MQSSFKLQAEGHSYFWEHRPTRMLLSEFLRLYVSPEAVVEPGRDVYMDVFALYPKSHIQDGGVLGVVCVRPEYHAYERVRDLNILHSKGIYTLSQWERAPDDLRAAIGVVTRGLIEAEVTTAVAGDVCGDADECLAMDQRPVNLHESVFNATWSYLEAGCADHPLGMKISSGTPPQMWTKDTLDEQPYIFFSEDICDFILVERFCWFSHRRWGDHTQNLTNQKTGTSTWVAVNFIETFLFGAALSAFRQLS
ncbi:putative Retrotransposon hot spot protein [Trypanosoma vivax]|nr:putative Retrotransposon hot spot protein [Trypanosoma vivax]